MFYKHKDQETKSTSEKLKSKNWKTVKINNTTNTS